MCSLQPNIHTFSFKLFGLISYDSVQEEDGGQDSGDGVHYVDPKYAGGE